MTAVADIRNGQTNMPYKGEHQTPTKQGRRYQLCQFNLSYNIKHEDHANT